MPEIMSTSPESSQNGNPTGRNPAKSPEKSTFSHTCSLLSRYLKQRGSFGDLNLGMTRNLDAKKSETYWENATMDLLPKMEVTGGVSERNVTPMELFPQHSEFGLGKRSDTRLKEEPENAPLTIFYKGRVHVFNNFPADRAKEVMLMASNNSSNSNNNNNNNNNNIGIPHQSPSLPLPSNFNTSQFAATSGSSNHIKSRDQPDSLDLPIARRISLNRFLEKRKERIISKAPYKLQREESTAASSKDSKSWLQL